MTQIIALLYGQEIQGGYIYSRLNNSNFLRRNLGRVNDCFSAFQEDERSTPPNIPL